jgi:hypothetical protein
MRAEERAHERRLRELREAVRLAPREGWLAALRFEGDARTALGKGVTVKEDGG